MSRACLDKITGQVEDLTYLGTSQAPVVTSTGARLLITEVNVRFPDLARFDDSQLESMLYSYRTLARQHIEAGHWALGVWATKMVTHITIEMNRRETASMMMLTEQLALGETYEHATGDDE